MCAQSPNVSEGGMHARTCRTCDSQSRVEKKRPNSQQRWHRSNELLTFLRKCRMRWSNSLMPVNCMRKSQWVHAPLLCITTGGQGSCRSCYRLQCESPTRCAPSKGLIPYVYHSSTRASLALRNRTHVFCAAHIYLAVRGRHRIKEPDTTISTRRSTTL